MDIFNRNERSKGMKLISAVELVKKYGISYQTLNYYTNLGLLEMVERTGRTRFYSEEDVTDRLYRIKDLQNKGYTLRLISGIINPA